MNFDRRFQNLSIKMKFIYCKIQPLTASIQRWLAPRNLIHGDVLEISIEIQCKKSQWENQLSNERIAQWILTKKCCPVFFRAISAQISIFKVFDFNSSHDARKKIHTLFKYFHLFLFHFTKLVIIEHRQTGETQNFRRHEIDKIKLLWVFGFQRRAWRSSEEKWKHT